MKSITFIVSLYLLGIMLAIVYNYVSKLTCGLDTASSYRVFKRDSNI